MDDVGRFGEEACLEVAASAALGAHARAGEIGTAAVGDASIDNDALDVYPRAQHALQSGDQIRIQVEIATEGRSRLLGVEQSDRHAVSNQLREDGKERHHACTTMDMQIL